MQPAQPVPALSRPSAAPPAPRPGEGERLERELKYALPASRAAVVLAWLRRSCRPDPRYPEGDVESLYFDTPELAFLMEKVNSDYRKTKVRLRRYPDAGGAGAVFIEQKERIGSRRRKLRLPAPGPAERWFALPLHAPALRRVPDVLRAAGAHLPVGLLPSLVLRYRRWRFVEPATGARVNLDSRIRVTRSQPGLLPAPLGTPWAHAVLEVKGSCDDLPPRLRGLLALGLRRASLSKYAAGCLAAGESA